MHTSHLGSWTLFVQPTAAATARFGSGLVVRAASMLTRVGDLLAAWHDRSQQRQTLASLDERMLSDIAANPATASEESRRPFWRYY